LMLSADGFQDRARNFLALQRRAHGGPAAVVITACERAGERVAGLAFLDTKLLFGGERQRAQVKAGSAQVGACLLGYRASHRARREVEDALELALAQGLDCREEHGDGLADAGGGFEEEPPAAGQRPVGRHGEFPLTRSVTCKGEGEQADGFVALLAPMMIGAEPVKIDCGCVFEEGGQLNQGKAVAKLSQFARVEVQVSQLDGDLLQGVVLGIDKSVNLGLGPMQWVGGTVPSALHSLDLLQQHLRRAGQQTVNPPLDSQDEISGLDLVTEAKLLLVAGGAGALEPLMATSPRQGAVRPDEVALAAEVALPQGELDQLAHLHRQDWFGGCCHAAS